jgi:hypothetical protein
MANGRGVTLNKAQKRTLETARLNQQEEGTKGTVVSSEDGAKVLKNLDILAESLEKITNRSKTFVGDVAKALGAKQFGSKSQYATFETKNGQTVTIRLGNHNATVSSFDNNGEDNGISIVISRHENKGITNDGNAHLVEYFYSDKAINRAEGKPLADIVRSIKQALYSGEYKDTTGLAEREEVNAEQVRMHRVYHGSGADFERFDHSHMGEGAQAFGWGTYVTEVEGIGKKYANSYGSVTMMMNGVPINDVLRNEDYWDSAFNWFVTGRERTLDELKEHISNTYIDGRIAGPRSKRARAFQEQKKRLLDAIERGEVTPNKDFTPIIYTVEIPEDNGSNYLEWDKPFTDEQKQAIVEQSKKEGKSVDVDLFKGTFQEEYATLLQYFSTPQGVSEFLHSAGFVGVKYPAEYYSGGRSDGAKNYVIFDEGDLQITDKVKFFRTESGEAYGFTMGGKIYLDPKIATAETPIHEYTHLWAAALRAANPKAWEQLKSELEKDKELVAYVRRLYPELAESNGANGLSDELADEMFAHFSGRRGAERLREEQRKAMDEAGDYVEKAGVVAMFERLRDVLRRFWNMARDLFAGKTRGIKSRSAEDFADMVLADLLGGFKPDRVDRNDRERDAEYMEAVESGDMEKAQRMVEEAARKAGYTEHAYHGTGRADRVGNVFRPERATSGPMAFFTTDREIAENYSRNKADTSLDYDGIDYNSYKEQFRTQNNGKDYRIYDVWGFIPRAVQSEIEERAKHVRTDYDGDGDIIYDPEATDGNGAMNSHIKDYRGNVIRALVFNWLESGNLWNREGDFIKVLEQTGVTKALKNLGFETPRYIDPQLRDEAVYDVYLKMSNPFDVVNMVNEKFIKGFEKFAAKHEDEYTKESMSSDGWDKYDVTASDFASKMREDVKEGRTLSWTSIPDVMTAYLKSLGYDGIKDAGGKYSDAEHTVWIPFSSEQIKRTDPVTYDDAGNVIPLSERFNSGNADIRYEKVGGDEIAQRDKEYAEAVAAGDKEKIDAMLREEMRRKGYADNSDYQGSLAFNGAAPSSNAYFETREERKEAFDNGELEGDFSLGDFMEAGIDTHDLEWQLANPIAASARDKATLESINNLRSAVRGKKKTIKMYRAVPADLKEGSFRNGDWVTPSRKYAEQHIELQDWEGGRIIEQEVSVDDIWWNGDDINEWGFDDGKGYAYKNTENNRKLMEPTYDDNGNRTPEDGQGARTPEDGQGARAPEDGQGARAPEDGQGARAPLGSFNPAYLLYRYPFVSVFVII